MPIVSISKIQHRYGLSENLPQLSAAELGWAIDQRRLFIGNGPTNEGAPTIGNTEILTQYSNLLEVAENAYSYKDVAVGFEAITGQSISFPTTRNLQAKLDDFANVRDYGAVGDGVTDDTDAINRALNDLYTRELIPASRRVLYFPAGNYVVNNIIKIPPYATLQGEGKNCTTIIANTFRDCVARIVDSKLQTGATIGSNGAIIPTYVTINDMTFNSNSLEMDVFLINSSKYTAFRRVGFIGGLADAPASAGTYKAAIKIFSTAINHSSSIAFDDCDFQGINYGVIADDDMENIVFDKCSFKQLFVGLKIGENTLGSGSSLVGPVGLRVTNSVFDKIYASGFINHSTAKVTSAFNTYLDVGNQRIANPTYSNIIFSGNGNASICDVFDRVDGIFSPPAIADQVATDVNSWSGTVPPNVNVIGSTGMSLGGRKFEYGSTIALDVDISIETPTGISFSKQLKAQRLFYIIERNDNVRQGYLDIICSGYGTTVSLSDTYCETWDVGVIFSVENVGGENGTVVLNYTSDSSSGAPVFRYSIERMITSYQIVD